MALHSREAWNTYFQNINIPDDVAATYATIFNTNWITTNTLADTTADDLRQLGIEIFGDIKAILRHKPKPLSVINQSQSKYFQIVEQAFALQDHIT